MEKRPPLSSAAAGDSGGAPLPENGARSGDLYSKTTVLF